ncbi:MAG: phenylacetate--CoA ligase [Bacteroidetes bacterium RIFCSPLOWO2_12_FULL_35_15]|nr:MAG: phenylacetate--CoA ligase [Bacteroidetes bacterium RIFCSPLOWO2_12_FULL_35_15]
MPEQLHSLNINEINSFQEKELKKALNYINTNSPFYKKLFSENNISIDEINSLDDLQKIPFTTKEDLQEFNNDFICVPPGKIIDYVTTSGTMGDPVTIALTDKDLDRLAFNECNSFKITGGTNLDIYQLMTTIDKRFMAGLAYFLGARKLGAGIVRVGNGIPELQWDTIKRISPTVLICVPSFILKLIEYAENNGIDFKNSSIKKAICIGEPLRNEDFSLNTLGQKIAEKWELQLYSTYASSEMGAAFTECPEGKGGHLQPELLIMEIIDDNGKPVKTGESGELVITTLGVEGMPLLRFKTGDICKVDDSNCACGRTTPRIGPVLGRKKQMIKYKGTTLYPSALYTILDTMDEVSNYQVEIFSNEIGTDEILIKIGCKSISENLEEKIKDHFRAKLRVAPKIKFENPEILNKSLFTDLTRKPIKLIDKRRNSK